MTSISHFLGYLSAIMVCAQGALSQHLDWKPRDFQPLTGLPWKGGNLTVRQTVEAIFREPNALVRYPVLADYLRYVELKDIPVVFDAALHFEGAQNPSQLVAGMLEIWAERQPPAAWEKLKQMILLVGLEEGTLSYDRLSREKIEVVDRKAIQKAGFFLGREMALGFVHGVEASKLTGDERRALLKDFSSLWFAHFDSWPRSFSPPLLKGLPSGVRAALEDHQANLSNQPPSDALEAEIRIRRALAAEPGSAPKAMEMIGEPSWRAVGSFPSDEALLLWAKSDPEGMTRWADSAASALKERAGVAKCILIPNVSKTTKERWNAEIKDGPFDEVETKIENLAKWNPSLGIETAISTGEPAMLLGAMDQAVKGPWWSVINGCHAGLRFIRDFDLHKLPAPMLAAVVGDHCESLLTTEYWTDVDVKENAKYGMKFLLEFPYCSRAELLDHLKAGRDEGGVLDRTYCSLRVWAVIDPVGMKQWIGTIKEASDVQNALRLILADPWGG